LFFRLACSLRDGQQKSRAWRGLSSAQAAPESALAGLETGVAFADHEHLAATTHDLAVAVPRLGGLQRVKHLHGELLIPNEKI
jgi:hypothetical protein